MDWFEQAVTGGLDDGWISKTFTKKRMDALREVHKKMGKETQEALPPLVIFAPSIYDAGQTMRREIPTDFAFVYLSPTLEEELYVDVYFAVAHEFAHVVLGHGRKRQRTDIEVEVDENAASDLAVKWGFLRRERKESRFVKRYQKCLEEKASPE
jgi:hypothetical protein